MMQFCFVNLGTLWATADVFTHCNILDYQGLPTHRRGRGAWIHLQGAVPSLTAVGWGLETMLGVGRRRCWMHSLLLQTHVIKKSCESVDLAQPLRVSGPAFCWPLALLDYTLLPDKQAGGCHTFAFGLHPRCWETVWRRIAAGGSMRNTHCCFGGAQSSSRTATASSSPGKWKGHLKHIYWI